MVTLYMLRMAMGGYLETKTKGTATFVFFNTSTMHLYSVFISTNYAQIYITKLSLYIMFTPTCFYISSGSLKNVCLVKLHKVLKLRLLELQFPKIIILNYTKILFSHH
jgi:hypothetical protein